MLVLVIVFMLVPVLLTRWRARAVVCMAFAFGSGFGGRAARGCDDPEIVHSGEAFAGPEEVGKDVVFGDVGVVDGVGVYDVLQITPLVRRKAMQSTYLVRQRGGRRYL